MATLRTTPLAAVTRARTFSVRLRPGASLPILQQARPPSKRPCETDRSRMPGPAASHTRRPWAVAPRLRARTTIR